MKHIYSFLFVWMIGLSAWAQSGNDYDPENPADPEVPPTPPVYYTLTMEAAPSYGGSVNNSQLNVEADHEVYCRAYEKTGYRFKQWMVGDSLVSTEASFYFKMPAEDVVLIAYFDYVGYDPENPADPEAPGDDPVVEKSYNVTVYATPSVGGYFNSSSFWLKEGEITKIYAYSKNGYRFESWMMGNTVVSTDNPLTIKMGTQDVSYKAVFTYNPEDPIDPFANSFNSETGEVVIDNFVPGSLSNTISATIGGSDFRSAVRSIKVIGQLTSSDFGFAYRYANCETIDLSRTTGYVEVPSYSFEDATTLKSVYLPTNVETIGRYAFARCTALEALYLYSPTPPTLGEEVFFNASTGMTVYVPSGAVELYRTAEGWRELDIQPLDGEEKSFTVNFPSDAIMSEYKNMTLELVNVQSGQIYRYIVTDRRNYTFYALMKNTVYDVFLKNTMGEVLAELSNVMLEEEDVNVSFASVKTMYDITLSVQTPEGVDVTSQTSVTWYDEQGTYLRQGNSISDIIAGRNLQYRIQIDKELALDYVQPTNMGVCVASGNEVVHKLARIEKMDMAGRIVDANTKRGIRNATVSLSQTVNKSNNKTQTVKTDDKGYYCFTAYNAPYKLAVSAYDYVTQIQMVDTLTVKDGKVAIPDVMLVPVVGATINISHTYMESVEEGVTPEIINWYKDYDNIAYDVYNVTLAKQIAQVSYRYPQLVLLDDAQVGDSLRITATSKKDAFMPVVVGTTIDSTNVIDAIFDIKQLGQIKATYKTTENQSVVGILYSSEGQLLSKYTYSQGELRIDELKDGIYYLVTMGKNELYNSQYNISRLLSLGLMEGVDYIKEEIVVESGLISTVSCDEVPFFDENKFNYIEMGNSSLYASQSSIVVGNYVTLVGSLDVIGDLEELSELKFMVDLPSTAAFVEGSVMIGETVTSNYTFEGGTLTIPLNGYKKGDKIKFCVIPTEEGEYAPNALVSFYANDREAILPIGSSFYTVEALTINVPSVTASKTITVSGVVAEPKSVVEIYDNDVLIARVTPLANGSWTAKCELNDAYNLSTHKTFAKVTTEDGVQYESETMMCEYDMNAIIVDKVTMYYNGYKNVFDFINPSSKAQTYSYSSNTDFTFTLEFSLNDTTKISNVVLYVKTMKNEWLPLYPKYDAHKQLWVASAKSSELGNSYPVNVSVDFDMQFMPLSDRERFDARFGEIENRRQYYIEIFDSINTINDEMLILEEAIVEDSILYADISASLNDNIDNIQNADSLLLLLLSISSDSLYSANDLDITIPNNIDKSYVDSVLSVCNMLLGDNSEIDSCLNSVDDILHTTDSLLMSLEFDCEQSLSFTQSDTITLSTDKGEILVYTQSLEYYNPISFTFADTLNLPMTDSTDVILYISDSDDIVIVDSLKSMVWILDMPCPMLEQRSPATRVTTRNFLTAMEDAITDIKKLVGDIVKNIIEPCASIANKELKELRRTQDDLLSNRALLCGESAGRRMKIIELEKQIKLINSQAGHYMEDYFEVVYKEELIGQLNEERSKVLNEIADIDKKIANIDLRVKGIKAKIIGITNVLGTIDDIWQLVDSLKDVIVYICDAISDFNKWHDLINRIEPCEDDAENAAVLKTTCEKNWADIAWRKGYYPAFGVSGIAAMLNGYMLTPAGNSAKFITQFLVGVISDFLGNTAEALNSQAKRASSYWYSMRFSEYKALKCKKEDDEDDDEEGTHKPQTPDSKPSIDPAGYVYEGVSSNRIEGVMASCYYKETEEDEYGIIQDRAVLWDATEFEQENPLFTDEKGMYQWFVPQGLWQVKFEKEGYETTYSEWLPVPPPQLEVNIPIVQNKQPEVAIVHAYEDGIVVEFDKYMQPATLNTSNIFVVQNGEKVDGTVVMLNEEIAYRDSSVVYASKVRFVFDQPITAEELTLTVSNRVKSYAGVQMQDIYTQTFDIEKEIKAIVADSLVSVFYGGEHTLAVKVTPADAAAGKTLVVTSSSPMILAVVNDSITLDSNGEAMVTVRGELPGSGAINYSIIGYDYTATTIVKVEYDNTEMTANPTASIASGTTVEKGTEVTLSCATEGAVIYYTLDGSCPCDEATRIRYDGAPIIINSNTELRMMAVAEGRYESDVVVYYYYVEGDVQMTANPTASIASGTTVAKGTEVTLSCATEGAVIYYTLDGSSPDDAATQIRYDGTPIVINETTTLRMMAVAEGYEKSYIVEYHYYVEEEVKVTAAPTASIASGTTVAKGTEVTLNCATEGAVIYYTLDGSSPDDTVTQLRYDGTPIVINETTTLRMMAVAEGYEQSYIVEYRYYVEDEEEPKPMEVTIHQKWDDVLICDNSNNEFVAYQWYKNDMPIAGETRQYYSEVGGLNGSYYVMAQNAAGDWAMSNTIVCVGPAESVLKVTPAIVKKNEKCVVSMARTEVYEESVCLNVYNAMGQMVRTVLMSGDSVELEFDNSGPYFIKAIGSKGDVESVKIIVIE